MFWGRASRRKVATERAEIAQNDLPTLGALKARFTVYLHATEGSKGGNVTRYELRSTARSLLRNEARASNDKHIFMDRC